MSNRNRATSILPHRLGSIVAALAFTFSLVACSVTEYELPIKTLSEATTSANSGLVGYSDLAVNEVRKVRREEAAANPVGVRIDQSNCLGDSERCQIVILRNRDDPNPRLLEPEPPIPDILRLMSEIRKYANGLQAIVTADTKARVEKSVDSVNGNLINLASLVGADAKAFGSFATPAGEAVKWIFGAYIDSVKLNALRTATRNADPLITEAVDVFEDAMLAANQITRDSLAEVVSRRHDAYRESPTDANLTNLVNAAQSYDAVLTAKPEQIFQKLAQAHSDLTKALNNDEVSWDRAFASLESVKSDAKKLEGIVSALLAAARTEER